MEAGGSGLAAGYSCILFALLSFLFVKTVACTSFLYSPRGDQALKHNDFHCVLHAGPAAP